MLNLTSAPSENQCYSRCPAYERHLDQHPDDASIIANLVAVIHVLDGADAAISYGRDAATRLPGDPALFNNLAICHQSLNEFDAAGKWAQKVVRLDPYNVRAQLSLADILVRAGRPAEALTVYNEVRRLESGNALACLHALHQGQSTLKWDGLNDILTQIRQIVASGSGEISPWGLLSVCHDPAELLRCATQTSARVETIANRAADIAGALTRKPALSPL